MPSPALLLVVAAAASPGDIFVDFVERTYAEQLDAACAEREALPPETCHEIVEAVVRAAAGEAPDLDGLAAALEERARDPVVLNSALNRAFGGRIPLGLEVKALAADAGDTVLGLAFDYQGRFADGTAESTGRYLRSRSGSYRASGTIAEDAARNPRDLVELSLAYAASLTTDIAPQSEAFGRRLTDLQQAAFTCGEPTSPDCQAVRAQAFGMLDDALGPLGGFRRYEFGLDLGLEADQEFEATQTRLSAFAFAQFEDWSDEGLLGALDLTPAFRIALDQIDPDDETPRALAGDASSYLRATGEASLWMPLGYLEDGPLVLTFNYRYHRELDPDPAIRAARLSSYSLRTYSLSGTNGMFVSYSSGRLPFDLVDDDVIEVGWRRYF